MARVRRRWAAGGRHRLAVAALPLERPVAVQVELTSVCNLRCRMCPLTSKDSSSSAHPGPMPDAVWRHVVAAARWAGRVALAGYGEPFTDRRCVALLRELDDAGVAIALATNGVAVTPEIARMLGAMEHIVEVNVSIDSPDPDLYRAIRRGHLQRALTGLCHLAAAVGSDRIVVSSVLMADNAPSLVAFPVLLRSLGVRRYSVQASLDYNTYAEAARVASAPADVRSALADLQRACDGAGVRLELSNPARSAAEVQHDEPVLQQYYVDGDEGWDPRRTRQCFVPWEVPFVDKDGKVFPCCFAASANTAQVGQLDPDGLDDVWTGVAFRSFRQAIVDGTTTPPICRRCTAVPLGTHLYREWAAALEGTQSHGRRVTVRYRNTGSRTWTRADRVRIGTSAPKDGPSALWRATWISENRVTTFAEDEVPPGSVATFRFDVAPAGAGTFRVVVDGKCWLPDTEFAVRHR